MAVADADLSPENITEQSLDARKGAAQARAAEVIAQIHVALREAKSCLQAAQQRQKRFADEHRADVQLAVGEQVLLCTKNIKLKGSTKLLPRWIGPFKVTECINVVAYRIDLPPVLKIHNVFHVSLLKQYKPGGRVQPPPLPEVIDGFEEYEVETILAHKKRGRKYWYYIKWLGYPTEHNQWVPQQNLTNCPQSVNEYWARVALRAEHKRGSQTVTDSHTSRRKKRK